MMKHRLIHFAIVLISLILIIGCLPTLPKVTEPTTLPVEPENRSGLTLENLPQWDDYRADPYIEAAAKLQSLGKDIAAKSLAALAIEESSSSGRRVIILCRLLFTNRPHHIFRPPELGYPGMIGEAQYKDWRLEPLELVDGVPFRITCGYNLEGVAETSVMYLAYCLRDCDWVAQSYCLKSDAEKKAALEKLLASPKWKKALSTWDRAFLAAQIK